MKRWLLYLAQWVVFAVRWVAALLYRVLQFFSTEGSLLIVPVLAAVGLFQFREELHDFLIHFVLLEFRPGHVPGALALDVLLAVLLAVALFIHKRLGRLLGFTPHLIVPVLATLAVLFFRARLHTELTALVQQYPLRQLPEPLLIDVALVLLLLLAKVLYSPLSHALWVVLGTFPLLNWPLPPQLPLIVKTRRVRPVVVRLAVPRLSRRWLRS